MDPLLNREKRKSSSSVSRRDFIKVTAGSSLLLSIPSFGWDPEKRPEEWWFVHLSDSHSGGEPRVKTLAFILKDLEANFPQARFAINTGDITEHGWEEELDEYVDGIKPLFCPHFEIMGNHDSRWSRAGRYAFRERFRDTRWAIEHEYLSLFALDCSLLVEQNGHLDPADLKWLEEQLERTKGKPALVAFHHPPCDRKRFLDTDGQLFRLISRYNVPGILAGHIHQIKQYCVNGSWVLTSGAVMTPKSGYNVFRVQPDQLTLYVRRPEKNETKEVMTIPFSTRKRRAPDSRYIELKVRQRREQIRVTLPRGFKADETSLWVDGHQKTFKVRQTDWKTDLDLPTWDFAPGHYELEAVSPGVEESKQRRAWGNVTLEPPDSVGLCWETQLPAGVQCRPAFWKNLVFCGTNKGMLYALNKETGKEVGQIKIGADEIISSPVVKGDQVFLGSIDGSVWCISAGEGRSLWKRQVSGSIIATGTFAGKKQERFIVGSGEGRLYAIHPETVRVDWTYQAGNLIKATPAYDGERLFFGAWDGCFYAVDAETGEEVWKLKMQTPHFSPATCNPQVINGRVIVVTHDYRTHCLDARSGEHHWAWPKMGVSFEWNSPIVADCKPSYSSAVFYEGVAYLGSLTGHVVGFDLKTGERTFVLEVDDPVFDSFPVLVGERMYFGTTGGDLYALNLKTKQVDWKYSLGPHFIFSPPESDGKHLVIGTLGGRVACFKVA